jgi:hypothetical protein
MNALDQRHSDTASRLAEIGEILARGLARLQARQSRRVSATVGESCLDFSVDQRGHDAPNENPGGDQ